MQLESLRLTNFRGLKEFAVDFNGKSVEVYDRNGTGKTTIANAIWWVLYGKALDG
jgi:DNA repair exonuclease SbcCD ATPase subunit